MGIKSDGSSIIASDDSTINSNPILNNNDDNSTVMTDDSSVQTSNNGYALPTTMQKTFKPSNVPTVYDMEDMIGDDDASTRTPIPKFMPNNLMDSGGMPSTFLRDRKNTTPPTDGKTASNNSNESSGGENFSEDGDHFLAERQKEAEALRSKREEENVGRLVVKAKQQHSFAKAWFAEAETNALPELPPRKKKERTAKNIKIPSNAPPEVVKEGLELKKMTIAIPTQTGPIDLDSGEPWAEDDKTTSISIPGTFAMTTHTMITEKRKNEGAFIQIGVPEEEDLTYHTQRKFLNRTACTIGQTRWSLLALLVLTVGLFATVGGAVLAGLLFGDGKTASPTTRPSDSPTVEVTTGKPSLAPTISVYPSLRPTVTPSTMPSGNPSSQPTSIPSRSPSSQPSTTPSMAPTSTPSAQPSLSIMPSISSIPTRTFENTVFQQIGQDKTLITNSLDDQFGYQVSLSQDGKILAAATPNYPEGFGSVTVYELIENESSSSNWVPLGQRIHGTIDKNQFGFSIQLSADGHTLVVGEPVFEVGTGRVQIFSYNDSKSWIQLGADILGDLTNSDFGQSVTISGDGRRVAIGAPDYKKLNNGIVFVHVYDDTEGGEGWGVGQRINGKNTAFHGFGQYVSLSGDGSTLACSAPNADEAGFVKVFKLKVDDKITYDAENAFIIEEHYYDNYIMESRFGWSISLSWDGSRIAVGSPDYSNDEGCAPDYSDDEGCQKTGRVDIYESLNDGDGSNDNSWTSVGEPIFGTPHTDQQLGWSVSLSYSGNRVAAGAYKRNFKSSGLFNAGQVVIHRFTNGSWGDGLALDGQRDNERFGFDVALGGDANVLAVGSPGDTISNGAVQAYEWIE